MSTTAIPKYGIVEWLDAVGVHDKVIPEKAAKKLAKRRSVGELFISAEGTLTILHEYDADKGFQKAVEATIIPAGWAQRIIPLVEAEDAVHQAKPTA